jgi:ABC-type nitrate/sulfonate/bicarbonate transport system substrate-binding protein
VHVLLTGALAVASSLGAALRGARAENEMLAVIVFAGPPNLPMFAAQSKGFYAKRGVNVEITFAHNSNELRQGLAQGRYHIAQAAIDNAFALKDKEHVDVAVVFGGDNSFNRLMVRPEINSFADIRGHTVVVDAVNTAFALQLYEMLRQNGVSKDDYEVKPAGSSPARLKEMINDKELVAAMMSPPYSIMAQGAGMKDMGSAAAALGAYQGSSLFVLRAWAQANSDTLVRYLQATIEGERWAFDAKNKSEAVALLAEQLKLSEDVATQAYESTKNDFNRDGALDMAGVDKVLKLRAEYAGGMPGRPETYIDLSYYQKAMAGL